VTSLSLAAQTRRMHTHTLVTRNYGNAPGSANYFLSIQTAWWYYGAPITLFVCVLRGNILVLHLVRLFLKVDDSRLKKLIGWLAVKWNLNSVIHYALGRPFKGYFNIGFFKVCFENNFLEQKFNMKGSCEWRRYTGTIILKLNHTTILLSKLYFLISWCTRIIKY
jgi:hypothetical protein